MLSLGECDQIELDLPAARNISFIPSWCIYLVQSLIVNICLMLSVYLCLIVITKSSFHCRYIFFLYYLLYVCYIFLFIGNYFFSFFNNANYFNLSIVFLPATIFWSSPLATILTLTVECKFICSTYYVPMEREGERKRESERMREWERERERERRVHKYVVMVKYQWQYQKAGDPYCNHFGPLIKWLQ